MTNNVLMSLYDGYKQFYISDKGYDRKNGRNVIASIAKINKSSFLYVTNTTEEFKENLKNIKENAVELFCRLNHATGKNSGFDSILERKIPQSSNEEIASVSFLNHEINPDEAEEYDLVVNSLADRQVNTGRFLNNATNTLSIGEHSFDVRVGDSEYEFQFRIDGDESNRNIQERLAKLINKHAIGIDAIVLENDKGQSALKISASELGIKSQDKNGLRFEFNGKNDESVKYLGLDKISNMPRNANIDINDENITLTTNSFEIDDVYHIQLNGISKTDADITHISIADDVSSIINGAEEMAFGYNRFINAITKNIKNEGNKKIFSEVNGILNAYTDDFRKIGIYINNDGNILIDNEKLKMAIEEKHDVGVIRDFSDVLSEKMQKISINPIKYIDKKIAAYKNPTKPQLCNPYVTDSAYSGMFLDARY